MAGLCQLEMAPPSGRESCTEGMVDQRAGAQPVFARTRSRAGRHAETREVNRNGAAIMAQSTACVARTTRDTVSPEGRALLVSSCRPHCQGQPFPFLPSTWHTRGQAYVPMLQ